MIRKRMARKLSIAIVGTGSLGSALRRLLRRAGYRVRTVSGRNGSTGGTEVVWLCVPDDAIAHVAHRLARSEDWSGRIVLHSSGALPSSLLAPLRARGAAAASAHPMMTFTRGRAPDVRGVVWAMEGDAAATRFARQVARELGGEGLAIDPRRKPLYHAFGSFSSPLLVALLAGGAELGRRAGLPHPERAMQPIVRRTIENCFAIGKDALSGPLARGDAKTIAAHLRALRTAPQIRDVYVALVKSALITLPVKNRAAIGRLVSAR
jgi:predicted short-subunit dehydrogenase-like oxidoreductase (DUF2520 family)